MTMLRSILAATALLMPAMSPAAVTNIAITNAGFEDLAIADGTGNFATFGTTAIPGWLISGFAGGGGGTANPTGVLPFSAGVPEGLNYGYAEAATLSQSLVATLSAGTYSLSMQIGNPNDRTDVSDPTTFDLYLPSTGRTILSHVPIAQTDIPNGTFLDFSATGAIGAADPDLGKAIGIRMHTGLPISSRGPYFAFDDVRLTLTTVPEPGTWALLSVGLGALAWRARRSASRIRSQRQS